MADTGFGELRSAKVDGALLAYREEGEGQPVVFVHGSLSDLRIWNEQVPEIGRRHRAIAYSRRYSPPGEDIPDGVDDLMPPHVDDLVAFLREIDAAPAHLVGSSWGGFISLLAAIEHPDVVRSLVLLEPPVLTLALKRLPPGPLDLLRLFLTRPRTAAAIVSTVVGAIGPATKKFREGDDEGGMQAFLRGVLGPEQAQGLPEERLAIGRENVRTMRAQLLGAGFPPLAAEAVRGVDKPTLLLTGEHSPAFLLRLSDLLEELMPRAERRWIADASHGMNEDNPAETNRAILEFLAAQGGAGAAIAPGNAPG